MKKNIPLILGLIIFIFNTYSQENFTNKRTKRERKKVNSILNGFHKAASNADEEQYFGYLADNAVFLGTDAGERWTKKEFRHYAKSRFSKGQGWTYIPQKRHIMFSQDFLHAWFDEKLFNRKYGELRGSGVLQKINGIWKIVHYNMVFTIPNQVTKEVVRIIKENRAKQNNE